MFYNAEVCKIYFEYLDVKVLFKKLCFSLCNYRKKKYSLVIPQNIIYIILNDQNHIIIFDIIERQFVYSW